MRCSDAERRSVRSGDVAACVRLSIGRRFEAAALSKDFEEDKKASMDASLKSGAQAWMPSTAHAGSGHACVAPSPASRPRGIVDVQRGPGCRFRR